MSEVYDAKHHTRKTYDSVKSRCGHYPHTPVNDRYIKNGITMCKRWRESWHNFIEDMGFRPAKNITLDRIDNMKGYFKENCRWASHFLQQYNKRLKPKNYFYDGTHSNKWVVNFRVDGKNINVGRFDDEKTAKKVAKGIHRLIDRLIEVDLIR